MKISLKLPPDLLFLLHQIIVNDIRDGIRRKSETSLRQDLFEAVYQRCKNYTRNPNGKNRTLSIWYHSAEYLLLIVGENIDNPRLGIFERNQLEIIKNELHQKLL